MANIKRVNAGDPINGLPADMINFAMDGARSALSRRIGQQPAVDNSTDSGVIWVKNMTGEDLPAFSVLGIDDAVVFDEDDNETGYKLYPTFEGSEPDEDEHEGKFCVTIEPCLDGRRCRAVALGVVYCEIDITDEAHQFADVTDGETGYLTSGESGFARILRKPEGTGQKKCQVRLSGGGSGSGGSGGPTVCDCGDCLGYGAIVSCSATGWDEAVTVYTIPLPEPWATYFGAEVELVHVEDCTWRSDQFTDIDLGDGDEDYYFEMIASDMGPEGVTFELKSGTLP